MNVSIGQRWQQFVDGLLEAGRYGSASEIVREGLRLVEERETKLQALRETIHASIERGGERSDEEVAVAVEAELDQWEQESRQQATS
jgi:antitoxin ParD1/3/4